LSANTMIFWLSSYMYEFLPALLQYQCLYQDLYLYFLYYSQYVISQHIVAIGIIVSS